MSKQVDPAREVHDTPPGRLVQVLHNAASGKTILEMHDEGVPPLHRIYYRSPRLDRYSIVESPIPARSLENVVGCNKSWVFARSVEWTKRGEHYGGKTRALARIDLLEEPSVIMINLDQVIPQGVRIIRLIRANDSGAQLEAIARILASDSGAPGSRAIGVVDLDNGRWIELARIPNMPAMGT